MFSACVPRRKHVDLPVETAAQYSVSAAQRLGADSRRRSANILLWASHCHTPSQQSKAWLWRPRQRQPSPWNACDHRTRQGVGGATASRSRIGGRGARRVADLPDRGRRVKRLVQCRFLQIAEGDFVSFIGPSGCGKTTMLRVIADLEQPTAGTILVNGITAETGAARAQLRLYLPGAGALIRGARSRRNVTLPLEIMGFARKRAAARARERYLSSSSILTGFERKFPWQLSGGMQQRVSIARALSFDPAMLLMDEPFGALDEIVRDHLNEQLLRLWKSDRKRPCCSSPIRFPKRCSCRPRSW